ncbi:MAG TPA: hypothetical protein PKY56_09185 [Candidatus Kapabacteria bacterium]|nr:hypothetical protein [Candidatus Kapabacteria bacterium]
MEKLNTYEKYPVWIIVLSNCVFIVIYLLGFLIILEIGFVFALFYLFYILFLEYRLIKNHCTDCYYFGKACGFGRGLLSSLFFKKGDISKFCSMEMTWKDLLPDMLVSLIPLITGIVLLIIKFNFVLLIELVILVLLTTIGNSIIRGKFTCKFCKQREIGCPAEKLFDRK